jgi:hypothetical protein
MFYHNGKLSGGGGYKRSTCVEEFTPNEDGTIPSIKFTTTGVKPIQTLNPFELQEAETINKCSGVLCEGDYNGCYASNITKSSYIKVRNVDFGEAGAKSFKAVVRTTGDAVILIRTKTAGSAVKGRVDIESTDGEWQEVTVDLTSPITGVQDLFFTFTGTTATSFDFDKWQFFEQPTNIKPRTSKSKSQTTYDLQGRKINKNTNHSIKIIDGKKIIK